jgi:hypothetical protein
MDIHDYQHRPEIGPELGTGYQVSGTGYLAPGTGYPVPDSRRRPDTEHRGPSLGGVAPVYDTPTRRPAKPRPQPMWGPTH